MAKKNPHAVALGRLGGKKGDKRAENLSQGELSAISRKAGTVGGKALAAALNKKRRRETAKKAAAARWKKPKAASGLESEPISALLDQLMGCDIGGLHFRAVLSALRMALARSPKTNRIPKTVLALKAIEDCLSDGDEDSAREELRMARRLWPRAAKAE